ncbi:transcription factor Opi1-domain-containing protein [Mycena olivaceomarginata]|nr:transcription factor Opi1-domain-containing protein [Mycena olivaceomarginata]
MDLQLEDEDVRIAVRALGQMRNGVNTKLQQTSPTASTSTSHTPALSLSLTSTHPAESPPRTPVDGDDGDEQDATGSPEAIEEDAGAGPTSAYPSLARMQSLPLVSGALRVYDTAKTNSRVVQYTSSLVSSSLRHGTSLLPAGSGERIDEFAGGMLDRRLFCLTCAVVHCRPFFAVVVIRRPCALALEACARDSTTRPLQPAWAGAGCLPQPAIFEIFVALVPAPLSLDRACPGAGDRIYPCFPVVQRWALRSGEGFSLPHRCMFMFPFLPPSFPASCIYFLLAPSLPSRPPVLLLNPSLPSSTNTAARPPRPHRLHPPTPLRILPPERRTTTKKKTLDGSPHEDGAGGGYADGPFDARGDYPRDYGGRGAPRHHHSSLPQARRPPLPPPEAHDSGGLMEMELREGEERQVAQRSRWQAVLLEAGGLSAALSDESMRRLRYCLSWLQYATQTHRRADPHLRDFIASLHPHPSRQFPRHLNRRSEPELTPDHLRTLAHLRSDIVHTIRQVVGVVSKYAGGALRARRGRVRGFILDLPKRFSAESSGSGGMSPGAAGTASATGVAAAAGSGGRRGGVQGWRVRRAASAGRA